MADTAFEMPEGLISYLESQLQAAFQSSEPAKAFREICANAFAGGVATGAWRAIEFIQQLLTIEVPPGLAIEIARKYWSDVAMEIWGKVNAGRVLRDLPAGEGPASSSGEVRSAISQEIVE
jgi:hypothetical protein